MPIGLRAREQRLDRAARQLVVPFDRLIAVGGGADRDVARRSRTAASSSRVEHVDEVLLDEDDRRELVVGVHLELGVVAARVAVVAAVRAAAIGIEGPLERHPLDAVQRRAAGDLLIARLIGPPLRLGQRGGAAVLHRLGDVARRGSAEPRSKRSGNEAMANSLLFAKIGSRAAVKRSRADPRRSGLF